MVLVIFVVYLFLQNWRATFIPMIAVPVSLIGTFAVFPLLGFSINTLSLFGLVLAIGLVVDDAIVVVEAVEHHIEEGMTPRDATLKAMEEVSGPVVSIALILASVFIPVGFMAGIQGRLNKQFAITIAISVLISAFNALTLSPALSAMLLRPRKKSTGAARPLLRRLQPRGSRRRRTATSASATGSCARRSSASRCCVGVHGRGGRAGPAAADQLRPRGGLRLLPAERAAAAGGVDRADRRGVPEDRSAARAHRGHRQLQHDRRLQPAVARHGRQLRLLLHRPEAVGRARPPRARGAGDRESRSTAQLRQVVPEATAFAVMPPSIPGLGTQGGFSFWLQDRSGGSLEFLNQNLQTFLAAARKRPELAGVTSQFTAAVPQLFADVDRDKVLKQGVALGDVYQTMQAFLGGLFVNQFNRFGRQWRVFLQAEGAERASPAAIGAVLRAQQRRRRWCRSRRSSRRGRRSARSTPTGSTSTARRR